MQRFWPRLAPVLCLVVGFSLSACSDRRYTPPTPMMGLPDGAVGDVAPEAPMGFDLAPPVDMVGMQEPDVPVSEPDTGSPPDAGPFCGNGVKEVGEACDDGNAKPGDGCSGVCAIEPFFECPTAGQPCVSLVVCGDGKITAGEACDDLNKVSGDGCTAECQVEGGYACVEPGKPCTKTMTAMCGDGLVNSGEGCDDKNLVSGDGCSATCSLEGGYVCPQPGMACLRDAYCGDGRLDSGEQCDDKNSTPGDGCTGACKIEPFFECPTAGQLCTSTIVCGDSKVIGDEACDDGNKVAGDGCSADCKQVEPKYTCPRAAGVGGPCTAVPVEICGNGNVSTQAGEFCDDGNATAGDGCDASCRIEPGYTCSQPGKACTLVELCGDGRLALGREGCDDGNTTTGDGCTAQCVVETNYVCPVAGKPCQSTVVCGDRKVTGGEKCDDGGTVDGDGCDKTCQVEAGWSCPSGAPCRAAACGDGKRVGAEKCDDGNANNGDGCSSSCVVESPGPTEADAWTCPITGGACTRTTCGNGMVEGSEQCDDANNNMGDGCTPFCRKEPTCPAAGGACATSCGDGLLLPIDIAQGQECDDGNTVPGDGCSELCKKEAGYDCVATPYTQDPLILPIILRDFKGANVSGGHPDFESYGGSETGIVQSTLGSNGKPVHVAGRKDTTTNNDPGVTTDYFAQWYTDVPMVNLTFRQTLTFTKLMTGEYQYNNNRFFPLTNLGFGNSGNDGDDNLPRNFHFTSEVRYWFEYNGGESFDFTGDDDVFVFVNKRLAVDLGGVHGARTGNIQFRMDGSGDVCDLVSSCSARRNVNFGMVPGSVYEIVVFQAERHTTRSNYRLTLGNFKGTRSVCTPVCGDAVVTPNEACDLGAAKNTGAYETCNADCTLPARCGDALVNGAEECDDGVNQTTYGAGRACGPGCKWGGYCGDGKPDTASGEECDDGANNGKGYGFCTSACKLGPRCGDGVASNGEECDDGANNGAPASACMATCKKKCGNGAADPGELCDNGAVNNTGGYGQCTAMCTPGPRCGDGIPNGPEQCDDGKNDGSYGTCAPMCLLGPRCGDSVVQATAGEVCDAGAMNSAAAYGTGKCDARCRPAPYCGDKKVDASFGEKCDDGVNSGQPGSCKTDCSDFVPDPRCGDGVTQSNEQCDEGAANGQVASACDIHCRKKCGNGFKDPGEDCDDGVNSGSYGTCLPTCKLAGYCGDGVQNGPEQCDRGAMNEANPYGPDKCTTMCTTAPRCGDGRIQSAFGEVCDSTPLCDNNCSRVIID
jgi:fibro-slime domain-containing protein